MNCDEIDYGTSNILLSRLLRKAEEECTPLFSSLEITQSCNLRCVHCYNFDRAQPVPPPRDSKLTTSEIIDIISQLKDAGCLYLTLTGGEPLIHPCIEDIIRFARKRRLVVRLKTNGTFLTKSTVEMLSNTGVAGIDVSLYGATAPTHDAFTAIKGSFNNTIAGIDRALEEGLAVKINFSVVRGNATEVTEMLNMVRKLDVSYGFNIFITKRYDGTDSSLHHALDGETLETLYRGPLNSLLREPNFSPNRSVQCGCARVTCGITATGEVYPCIGAPVLSGNLRQQRFSEIWNNSPQFIRIRSLNLNNFETCSSCPDRPYCGRNSGVALSNTGEYTGPEPTACMDASILRRLYVESGGTTPTSGTPPLKGGTS